MDRHKETITFRMLVQCLTGMGRTYPMYHPIGYHNQMYFVLCASFTEQRASYIFYRRKKQTYLFCGRVIVSHGRIYLNSEENAAPCHRRIPPDRPLRTLRRQHKWRELYKAAMALCELDPLWVSPRLTEEELERYYD